MMAARFQGAFPIGDTDVKALPVKELGPAVGYYTQVLGFALVARDTTIAMLQREDAHIGLAVNGKDPEQASCYFEVSDLDALRLELDTKGIDPGKIHEQNYGGNRYRVFFAKEPYGVCFCFGQKL